MYDRTGLSTKCTLIKIGFKNLRTGTEAKFRPFVDASNLEQPRLNLALFLMTRDRCHVLTAAAKVPNQDGSVCFDSWPSDSFF